MDTISVERIAERCEAEFERLRVARPALSSRISRAENILVTHLSCPEAGIVRPRVRGGELVGYLVKGTGGAVYRVEPGTFSCSCPDFHRRGKGCKHSIACYALGRAFRPSGAPALDGPRRHRCGPRPGFAPKRLRQHHDVAGGFLRDKGISASDFEHAGDVAARVLEGIVESAGRPASLAECAGCGRRFPQRELVEVTEDRESLTWFVGDRLCLRECAGAHGIL